MVGIQVSLLLDPTIYNKCVTLILLVPTANNNSVQWTIIDYYRLVDDRVIADPLARSDLNMLRDFFHLS